MSSLAKVTMNPMIVADAVKEVSTLCNSIVEYRKLALQTEFACEQMHRQADMQIQQINLSHRHDMEKLKTLSNAHDQVIKETSRESDRYYQLLQDSQRSIDKLQNLMFSSKIKKKDRELLQAKWLKLQSEREQLLSEHSRNVQTPLQAFAMLNDSLRTQPREFTGNFKDVK